MVELDYTVRCQKNPDRYVYDGWQTEIIRRDTALWKICLFFFRRGRNENIFISRGQL